MELKRSVWRLAGRSFCRSGPLESYIIAESLTDNSRTLSWIRQAPNKSCDRQPVFMWSLPTPYTSIRAIL